MEETQWMSVLTHIAKPNEATAAIANKATYATTEARGSAKLIRLQAT